MNHQPLTTQLVHCGHFYTRQDELLRVSAEFVNDGLRRGEPVLVAQPKPNLDRLAATIKADGVTWVDLKVDGRNPGRILPWVMHAFAREHTGRLVRIIGEPMWPGRTALEYPACLQHEALVNYALRDCAVKLMCPYDVTGLTVRAVRDARLTHPLTMNHTGVLRKTAGFDADALRALLDQTLPRPPGRATALTFSGSAVRLVRQLVGATARGNGLDPDRVQALTLAVNEAATNAVRHGGGQGIVRLWTEHGYLVADVHSAIPLDDPTAGRLHPEPTDIAARGLPLIHYLCDLVRWSRGTRGTHIRMWMRLGETSSP